MTIHEVGIDGEIMTDVELKLFNLQDHKNVKSIDLMNAIKKMEKQISIVDLGAIQGVKLTISIIGKYVNEGEKG